MIDVIIIGAGLSGLTTALKIIQKDPTLQIKMFEANNYLGGQMYSPECDPELGGTFFSRDHNHILSLLIDLGIHMRRVTSISTNLKRCWTLDKGPFAFIANFEAERYMKTLDVTSQIYWPGNYEISMRNRRHTMSDHIESNLFFNSSRLFMYNFVRLVTGVDAKDISFVEFMSALHSCGSLKTLLELYIEPNRNVFEFSAKQLLQEVENRIETVSMMWTKITEIRHHEDYVEVTEENGTVHTSRVAILAVPSNYIEDIYFSPTVPPEFEIPFVGEKHYITSFRVAYEESHWRHHGFSGNFYSALPAIFAHEHKPNTLSGYILHGPGYEQLTKSIVLSCLAECFGNEMTDPQNYCEHTYESASLLSPPLTTPWNRIIWSSTSTATLNRGCLNGAVQSGLRAAMHALLILSPQSIGWQDLVEIQKNSLVYRYPSNWDLLMSSLNVYNTVVYATVALGVFFLLNNILRIFK